MADRSFRLFQIIQTLRAARQAMTARALAAGLEVTVRTIYRDVATLIAAGVPIEGEAGVGYVMRAGYDLPPLMFTAEEVEAVVVGLALIGRTRDRGLLAAAETALQKVGQVLPVPLSEAYRVSTWSAVPAEGVEHQVIRTTIREERKLTLSYVDAQGQATRRCVLPLAVVYYIDSAVLAAWCELREDFRHFRLDRIRDCAPLATGFRGHGAGLRAVWQARYETPPGN
ncbi:MAG: YafY family transcriptional regulator [Tabrizicola sp.]|nr:YafY family transcriptional regulator [Tabrizicola sp.]